MGWGWYKQPWPQFLQRPGGPAFQGKQGNRQKAAADCSVWGDTHRPPSPRMVGQGEKWSFSKPIWATRVLRFPAVGQGTTGTGRNLLKRLLPQIQRPPLCPASGKGFLRPLHPWRPWGGSPASRRMHSWNLSLEGAREAGRLSKPSLGSTYPTRL